MIVGFYYHVPIFSDIEGIKLPSYLGVFINALANEVEHLVLVMHDATLSEISNCDYLLPAKNVSWVNFGKKTPAWHRAFFHKKLLKNALSTIDVDFLLVRCPSPLAPYFRYYFPKEKIRFLIVGDYESGIEGNFNATLRQKTVNLYLYYYSYLFYKAIQETALLVNSPALYTKYKDRSLSCHLVGTTTLSDNDFFVREDTCRGDVIHLLYTGRLDLQKGLLELLFATSAIVNENYPVNLHFVGWEDNPKRPVEELLKIKAKELGIGDVVIFHGKKKVGKELNQMYRMADIYVIPSYHEGFPRTIWEAMANSLPVIATKVGGIPSYLQDGENASLITPKSLDEITNAIKLIISKDTLRKRIIINGFNLAKRNTLGVQTKKLIEIIS